jgi:hypothetical protein
MHISEADWSAAVKDLNLTRRVFSVRAAGHAQARSLR